MNDHKNPNEDVGTPLLEFVDVNGQKHFRASSGISETKSDATPLFTLAVEFASRIIAVLRAFVPVESIDAANVALSKLQSAVLEIVWSLEEFGQNFADDLELQKHQLREVRQSGTQTHRRVGELINQESDRLFNQAHKALNSLKDSPFQAKEMLEKLSSDLKQLSTPEAASDSSVCYRRLCNALPVLRQLAKKEYRRRLEPALMEAINSAFRLTIAQHVKQRAIPIWNQQVRKLRESCDASAAATLHIRNKLESIFETLNVMHQVVHDQSALLENSIHVVLQPKSAEAFEAALTTHFRCDSDQELTDAVRDQWYERLQQRAAVLAPAMEPTASIFRFMVAIPVEVVCDELIELIEDGASDALTIYTQVENAGVDVVAAELHRRAKPMVRLGAYEGSEEVNILPTHSSRITFPSPRNTRDGHVMAELKESFRRLDEQVEFAESSDREISVVRMVLNYPIGIDENNLDMLISYWRAAERGHLPHLIGFADGSTDGNAISCVLELARNFMEAEA